MIFEPLQVGGVTLRNRLSVPPMVVTHCQSDGYAVAWDAEHYASFSSGGAGLIIQEATCISPTGRLGDPQLGIWEDGQIPGLKRITEAVHKAGRKIFVQLHHAGLIAWSDVQDAPCDMEYSYYGRACHGRAMSAERAEEIKQQFIRAGRRAYEAGYDGIELHGAHSYLISQLLNPEINRRTDALGQNPASWVREILEGIKANAEPGFAVGLRIGGYEPTIEQGLRNVEALRGAADFFDVSGGFAMNSSYPAQEKPADYPWTMLGYAAKRVKEYLLSQHDTTPVFTVGDVVSPELAEQALAMTSADLVHIGRGHLINPSWAADAQAGRDTGKCFHCPRGCQWKAGICPGMKVLERSRASQI